MSIPLTLRMAVAGLCRPEPARTAGTWLYWKAADRIAGGLKAIDGVQSVCLRGGMTAECRPALSDLDFTVIVEGATPADEIRQCRQVLRTYRRMATALPILGELTLTTSERWQLFQRVRPGPLLWYRRQLEFRDSRWREHVTDGEPHPLARFSLAFDHYHFALKALHARQRSYGRMVFDKEIAKSLRHCNVAPQTATRTQQAVRAFRALDALATAALAAPLPPAPGRLPCAPLAAPHPVTELLGEWRRTRLLHQTGRWLRPGDSPFTVIGDPQTSESWMAHALKPDGLPLPLLPLSPAMAECQRDGWGGWWTHEALRWFPPGGAADEARRQRLLRSLMERLCHDGVSLLPGRTDRALRSDREKGIARVTAETRALRAALDLPPPMPRSSADDPTEAAVAAARDAHGAVREAMARWNF